MGTAELTGGLRIGDRLPNFERHDPEGRPVVYYDVYCGRPLLLLLALDPTARELPLALETLAGLERPACAVMVPGGPPAARALAERTGTPVNVLADDGEITRFITGPGAAEAPLLTLLLDANARVLGRWWGAPAQDQLGPLLATDEPGREVRAGAPVLLVPRVFEPAFCRRLIAAYRADNEPSGVLRLVDGRMVYETDDDTKIRREHRIAEPALLQAVEQRLAQRVLPEIERAFNYRVTRYEAFKVVCYEAATGGHFRAHRDNNGPDTAHRRFALTLNLNSEEYAGGELAFPEYGADRYKPPTGGAAVFSCSLAHAALAVERGTRYALVSFFYGDDTLIRQVEREDRIARGR